MSGKNVIFSLLALCACMFSANSTDMRDNVAFLAGIQTEGRATGTPGNQKAAFYLVNSFRGAGLADLGGTPTHSFAVGGKEIKGHNVIGMLDTDPSNHSDKYIVIGAHFDGLGTLQGQTYPCADANASGVAVMLQLAKHFSRLIERGRRFNYNIVFVGFDGFHEGISGAKSFLKDLEDGELTDPVNGKTISCSQIAMMVDLCQLGGCEPPLVPDRKNYLIILGENSLPDGKRGLFHSANCMSGNNLDLYMNFYGSEKFTNAFYRMGDRKVFIAAGIPTLLFTSGITGTIYSKNDTAESLDYPNLEKRWLFIYNYLFLFLSGN